MPKRRQPLSVDSPNSGTDKETPNFLDDSEHEDASFTPTTKALTRKKRKVTGTRNRNVDNASLSQISGSQEPDGYDAPCHSRSTHTIVSPGPMRKALLSWFKTVHDTRGMPWRRAYDPNLGTEERAQRAYEVWVSEIMLQQTQVATVIPYYNRWMEKFPTIRDLADASIDEVNSLWKGLGYYSRASRLLAGAKKAVAEYDGKLPDNAKDMQSKIPGIGRYSAGAICSIAYGERVPVLDGNVHRLLSRVLALHSPPKAKPTLDILWAAAQTMVEIEDRSEGSIGATEKQESDFLSPQYPGDINQALIELGSTVCKINTVADIEDICDVCEPFTEPPGVTAYPMKAERKKAREELDVVHVIEWHSDSSPRDRMFLMVRRPENGLLAGLYDFPTSVDVPMKITVRDQESLTLKILPQIIQGASRISRQKKRNTVGHNPSQPEDLVIAEIQPVGDVVHVFSHIKKTYRIQLVVLEGGVKPPAILENPLLHDERPTKIERKEGRAAKNVNVTTAIDASKPAIWVPLNEVVDTMYDNDSYI
ncbi:Adenine DNA glycosylase [Psilocybe cubensis]|uniref:Adenine DNA glycosylase n=2 Tax=Psilocybe cubensis TaxID=181762 RepID=A0ACB8GPY1_PSICU|nr:Adenine DNA glycosylase [Psilocybe cubensis]KAH9477783.1 Adenine DNA glycosylase [Psilocybe cubensis]